MRIKRYTYAILLTLLMVLSNFYLLSNYQASPKALSKNTEENAINASDSTSNMSKMIKALCSGNQTFNAITNWTAGVTDLTNGVQTITKSQVGKNFTENCTQKFLNIDASVMSHAVLGQIPDINQVIEMNMPAEIISSYEILSQVQIKDFKGDAIATAIKSFEDFRAMLNKPMSDTEINEIEASLISKVTSQDYLVNIRWTFKNGVSTTTYGIYDSSKAAFIIDPVLSSFPEYKTTVLSTSISYSNNSIVNAATISIHTEVILYTVIFWTQVNWLQIDYYFTAEYYATPVVDGSVTQNFQWSYSSTKTLLNLIGGLDQFAVSPVYSLPTISFYYKGSLINTQSNGGSSSSGSVSYSSSSSSQNSFSYEYSYVYFDFQYGFNYFLSSPRWDAYSSSSSVITLDGVAPLQIQSASFDTGTQAYLGQPITIDVWVYNPNSYTFAGTVAVDSTSLQVSGITVLSEITGDTYSTSYTFGGGESKEFQFTFLPSAQGTVSPKFTTSGQIYEYYYDTSDNEAGPSSLGPTRSSSLSMSSFSVVVAVPAFSITGVSFVGALGHPGVDQGPPFIYWLEPGVDFTLSFTATNYGEKLGNLTVTVYLRDPSTSTVTTLYTFPMESIAISGFYTYSHTFNLGNSTTSFGRLPASRDLYFGVSYSWAAPGAGSYSTYIDNSNPYKIKFEFPAVTASFSIVDQDSTRYIDGHLKVSSAGQYLTKYDYSVTAFSRNLHKKGSDLGFIVDAFTGGVGSSLMSLVTGPLAKGIAAAVIAEMGSLVGLELSAESAKKTAFWLSEIPDIAGYLMWIGGELSPEDWSDSSWQPLTIATGTNVNLNQLISPYYNGQEYDFGGIDKQPLVASAPGNSYRYVLPSWWCQGWDAAYYTFSWTVRLYDSFGNYEDVTTQTAPADASTQGKVSPGIVSTSDIYDMLMCGKDQLICRAFTFTAAAVVYGIAAAAELGFNAAMDAAAIACAITAGIYWVGTAILQLIMDYFCGIDPSMLFNQTKGSIQNYANDSRSGIATSFVGSLDGIVQTGNAVVSNLSTTCNAMINNQSTSNYDVNKTMAPLMKQVNDFSNLATAYTADLQKSDVPLINDTVFNEAVSYTNSSGLSPAISNLLGGAGMSQQYLEAVNRPGLLIGDPSPLRNITTIMRSCITLAFNATSDIISPATYFERLDQDSISQGTGAVPTQIPTADITSVNAILTHIQYDLNNSLYNSALTDCNILDAKIYTIVNQTHNSTIIQLKEYTLSVRKFIWSQDIVIPELYSDRIIYDLGTSGTITTVLSNEGILDNMATIEVVDSPSFIKLNYNALIPIAVGTNITSIQTFSIPVDWRISPGVYNITLRIFLLPSNSIHDVHLSIFVNPYHNVTIQQVNNKISLMLGTSGIISYNITNFGSIAETFTVQLQGNGSVWATMAINITTIDVHSSSIFVVNVTIPMNNSIAPNNYSIQAIMTGYKTFVMISRLAILPFYSFIAILTPIEPKVLYPGNEAIAYFYVENHGNTQIDIRISTSIHQPWFIIPSIHLKVNGNVNQSILLQIPKSYLGSSGVYNETFHLFILENPSTFVNVNDTFTVIVVHKIATRVMPSSISVYPGNSVQYGCSALNLGNVVDTYGISITPANITNSSQVYPATIQKSWVLFNDSTITWNSTISGWIGIFTLNPGQNKTFTLSISVPSNWAGFTNFTYRLAMLAVLEIDSTINSSTSLNMTVISTLQSMKDYVSWEIDQLNAAIQASSYSQWVRPWYKCVVFWEVDMVSWLFDNGYTSLAHDDLLYTIRPWLAGSTTSQHGKPWDHCTCKDSLISDPNLRSTLVGDVDSILTHIMIYKEAYTASAITSLGKEISALGQLVNQDLTGSKKAKCDRMITHVTTTYSALLSDFQQNSIVNCTAINKLQHDIVEIKEIARNSAITKECNTILGLITTIANGGAPCGYWSWNWYWCWLHWLGDDDH